MADIIQLFDWCILEKEKQASWQKKDFSATVGQWAQQVSIFRKEFEYRK